MEWHDRVVLSKLRLERAKEFLTDAEDTAKMGKFLNSANRSYYAAYTSIRALIVFEHTERTSHMGNISDFRLHYIKTGIFKREFSDYIREMFTTRNESDYEPDYVPTDEVIFTQLGYAKEMLEEITAYLNSRYDTVDAEM